MLGYAPTLVQLGIDDITKQPTLVFGESRDLFPDRPCLPALSQLELDKLDPRRHVRQHFLALMRLLANNMGQTVDDALLSEHLQSLTIDPSRQLLPSIEAIKWVRGEFPIQRPEMIVRDHALIVIPHRLGLRVKRQHDPFLLLEYPDESMANGDGCWSGRRGRGRGPSDQV
mgnify:CR=1 FL=1